MKVVEYGRVSTEKQTLEQQNRTVQDWLQRHNLKADVVITEEGISGGVSYQKRKLGTDVLSLLEPGDMLIVAEISRLGRSMSDLNKLINDELKPRKIRLVIVQMGIDLDCGNIKAMDEMILFAFSFASQLERELIQERTQSAMNVRKQKIADDGGFISKAGNWCTSLGGTSTGQSKGGKANGQRRIKEAMDDPINKIIAEEMKYSTDPELIAQKLNNIGFKTKTGLSFNRSRVSALCSKIKKRSEVELCA